MIFLGAAALPTTRPITFTAGVGCPAAKTGESGEKARQSAVRRLVQEGATP